MQEIFVMAHCQLNPAVRLKGLKPLPPPDTSAHIIQLPCPEAAYLGLKRWEVTSDQLDTPNYRRFCRSIFRTAADTIQMLFEAGHTIRLIGVAGSPSCGTMTTTTGFQGGRLREAEHIHIEGTGIFFQEIIQELQKRGIKFNMDEKKSL